MAKIKLSDSSFTLIPEGTHTFKIADVQYNEPFGKLELHLETQEGLKHIERYSLLKSNGTPNDGAMNAFTYLAHVALDDFSADEIDTEDLIGHFFEADVTHDTQPSRNDPNKTVTFVRLGDKRVSEGWAESHQAKRPPLDLKALLG